MLPKSKLGRQMATKLKVYKGDKHPHEAQLPQPLDVLFSTGDNHTGGVAHEKLEG